VTHENACALLARYAAGALDLETAAELRRHIAAGCGECFHELFAVRRSPPAATRPSLSPPPPRVAAAPARARDAVVVIDDIVRHVADAAPPRVPHAADRASRARVATALIVAAVMGGAGAIAARGYTMLVGRPVGLAPRVTALEVERAELARRVAKLTHALFARRDATPSAATPEAGGAAALAPVVPANASPPARTPPAEEGPLIAIRYSPDRLSVRVRNADLADVLREIGVQSGVTLHARVLDARKVNVAFEDVPFKQALRRLLGLQEFLLTYDGPRPQMLEVLEVPAPPSLVVAASDEEPSADAPPPAQSIASMLDGRPAVTLSDTLGTALGTRAMPLRQLLDTGINHVDQAIRSTAIREAVDALQADPSTRAAMFGARPGMDRGIFGALVEGMDTARAEEMLFYVALAARDSQVRNDAATLIQRVAVTGTGRNG